MPQFRSGPGDNESAIGRALGEDFRKLHPVVRRHYSAPTVDVEGVMQRVHVKTVIRPFASLSYLLLAAPVPRGGRDVEFTVHSQVDGLGTMHWLRTFFGNANFHRDVAFVSHMAFSGDHMIIETTRFGMGVESCLSIDGLGSLIYDIQKYTIRVPFIGLSVRFPTWLTPFGGGRIVETGEDEDSFRVNFQMTHPIFGQTLGYTGRCWIS